MTDKTPSLRDAAQELAAIAEQLLADMAAKDQMIEWQSVLSESLDKVRAALALPEPEPVAWMASYINKSGLGCVYTSSSYSLAVENDANGTPAPLYAAPQPAPVERQPLTDDQLSIMAAASLDPIDDGDYFEVARVIEAAHGITPTGHGSA